MIKVVIIADDLTGANATGVLLARCGYKTGTFLSLGELSSSQGKTVRCYRNYNSAIQI